MRRSISMAKFVRPVACQSRFLPPAVHGLFWIDGERSKSRLPKYVDRLSITGRIVNA